jgi:restriction system protein
MKTLPKYDELMMPTLNALRALGGSASNDEIYDQVADTLNIPPELRDMIYREGSTTFLRDRLNWARTYLKKYGAIANSTRGVWALTDKGEGITSDNIITIKREVIKETDLNRKKTNRVPLVQENGTPQDDLDWEDHLLQILLAMKPDAFERLCQRILRESGFIRVEITGRSGDEGIDGYGILRMNLVSFQVLFQCKRWKGSVGSPVIRDFRGAMVGRADKGLILTTGTFTQDARKEATRDGAPAIDLVDGEVLCGLLRDLNLGVAPVTDYAVNEDFFKSI